MTIKVATRQIHRDTEPLATGTHKGASGSSTLIVRGANFRALGVNPSLLLYAENTTQSTNGTVTAADENSVTVSGVTWDNGDTYNIYKTSQKNSYISAEWVDVSAGFKINSEREVNDKGWRKKDWDINDRGRKDVFGPGQPEKY